MKERALPLNLAELLAAQICGLLANVCDKMAVAGSIRRRKSAIHDIDLIAIPKFAKGTPQALFDTGEQISQLTQRLRELDSTGKIRLLQQGDKAVRFEFLPDPVTVDLYIASLQTWPTLLLIRTGSREHNISMCTRAKSLGMQLKADGSGLFRGDKMVAFESERSIFEALGMQFLPPERREVPANLRSRSA